MVLALFDYHTTLEDKQVMAVTLVNTVRPQAFGTGKPGQPAFNPIAAKLTEEKPSLAVFSLSVCGCCSTFWGSDAAWLHDCKIFCCDLMVTNDPAERAVKDVHDCAQVTRDPAHRDSVILVRTDHRGRVAQLRKADLDNV